MALKVCQLCAVDFTLKHFLLPLIDGMEKEGWTVISVCSDGPYIRKLQKKGYNIETIYIARSYNVFQHFKSILALTRFFKEQEFDIVHVHSPIAAFVARLAARFASVSVVIYTAHGFYFHDEMMPLKRSVFLFLEKWVGKYTNILFTQSAEDAACAIEKNLLPQGLIYTIGNGVNPQKFNPKKIGNGMKIRNKLGIQDDAFVIGIIARLVEEKGICEFLEAAMQASDENDKLCFLVIGARLESDHAKGVNSKIKVAKDNYDGKILFLGQRTDIPVLLSAMDVFCLPSWREGMPRSIIEAMMMEKPVIATNIRGCREEVIDNETGFLVPTKDVTKLKNQFLYCSRNTKKIRKMGKAGRLRALRYFDEKNVVEKQVELIKAFIKNR